MTSTSPRVAIVTGGSRGIGRATAERLAADGLAVVVVYGGNKTEGRAAVDRIVANGGQAVAAQADVADEKAVSAVFDTAERTFGGVDVVVHAAAACICRRSRTWTSTSSTACIAPTSATPS